MGSAPAASAEQPAESEHVAPWTAFWRTLTRFESEKIAWGRAARNALGIALPLAAGYFFGHLATGLIVCSGALNVCFTDGDDPYRQRGKRMLAASVLVGFAVLCGTLSGFNPIVATLMVGIWAFPAGMMVALNQTANDLGVTTLVTLIVYAAQPLEPHQAVSAGLLAFGGGLLETILALAMWPVNRYEPERRALGNLYLELSRVMASPVAASVAPPATAQSIDAQTTLAALGADHTVEADRYRSLLNQAERMRLGFLTLARLRVRIQRDAGGDAEAAALDLFFEQCSRVLASIAASLLANDSLKVDVESLDQIDALAETLRDREQIAESSSSAMAAALVRDARHQADALAGQLRSSVELTAHSTPEGLDQFEEQQAMQPWTLRLSGRLATLRANLSVESAACRHAVRLAVCVALADAIGRSLSWRRAYWLPMTAAIVLKPDFTATFSRGVLRMAGTLVGLAVATALFHLFPSTVPAQVVLIGLLALVLRSAGAANYGILTAAVSALVVLLIGLTGNAAPKDVIVARGVNSIAGGALALAAYWLWPTWERRQMPENLARLLDAYRDYFHLIAQAYVKAEPPDTQGLNRVRQSARLARSNLQASVDRLSAEPGNSQANALHDILASSHRLAHALMALEAGLYQSKPVPPRDAFRTFWHDVERTLYFLAALLRGSPVTSADLPDLREDHHALITSGDSHVERYALVNIETDRVTNSLNTLSEQIFELSQTGKLR